MYYFNKKNMKKKYQGLIAFTMVTCFVVCILYFYNIVQTAKGPYWLGSNSDPEYAYLLNSLNVTQMAMVGHIDHPGTTLQWIGAAIIKITYLFSDLSDNIVDDVLSRPEFYLNCINKTLVAWYVTIFILLSLTIWLLTKSFVYLFILFASQFVNPIQLIGLTRVTPETLISILILLLIFLWCLVFISNKYKNNFLSLKIFVLGILAGCALFTKVLTVPIFCFQLFIWKPYKQKIFFVCGLLSISLLYLYYLGTALKSMLGWFLALFIGTGHYGSGTKNIIDPASFMNSIEFTINHNLYLYLTIFICTFVLIYCKQKKDDLLWRMLLVSNVSMIATCIIVFKHFSIHYLVSIFPFVVINLMLAIRVANKNTFFYKLILICFCFILLGTTFTGITQYASTAYKYSTKVQAMQKITVEQDTKIIDSYRTTSQSFALDFGNGYAKNKYTNELTQIYPNYYTYNIWNNTFYQFGTLISIEKIVCTPYAYIRGTNFYKTDYNFLNNFEIETLFIIEGEVTARIQKYKGDQEIMCHGVTKKLLSNFAEKNGRNI